MSAAVEPTAATPPTASWLNHRNLVVGLYWSAFLLLVLTNWVGTKHAASAVPWGVGLILAATLALAGWQTWQLVTLRRRPHLQDSVLQQQRRLTGLAALGLAGILLLLMVWLVVQEGRSAVPEVSSGVVLALVGLGAGLAQVPEVHKRLSQQLILEGLVRQRQRLTVVLLGLGAAAFVAGLWVFLQNRDSFRDVFPLGGGLVLGGLILVGGGLWLLLTGPQDVTANSLRLLVLVVGGALGVVIAVMTAVAIGLRWDTLFAGGMAAWHGGRAWQLWLAIYVELFGLVLMFGSLSLSRGDIRRNAALRRALYGYNAVFMGLLVLALLVVLNILVYASLPYNLNWTATQTFYSLSPQSTRILDTLKEPTTIYVLMTEGVKVTRDAQDYKDVRTLLENVQAYNPKVQVQYVSPDADPAGYERLLNDYPKIPRGPLSGKGRGLLLVYGRAVGKKAPPSEFIREAELSESPEMRDPRSPAPPREFRGEQLIMTRLNLLTHTTGDQEGKEEGKGRPVIYFSLGFGELPIVEQPDQLPLAIPFRTHLERNNFIVRTLFWGFPRPELPETEKFVYAQKDPATPFKVPDDAAAVVLLWPRRPYPAPILKALDDYMARKGEPKGKLVVFSTFLTPEEKLVFSNLGDFLKRYGVAMENDVILTTPEGRVAPQAYVMASMADRNDTDVARAFARYKFLVHYGRTVRPASGPSAYRAQVLMQVVPPDGEYVWADKFYPRLDYSLVAYVDALVGTGGIKQVRSLDPLPVAVTVTEGPKQTPRLVVFGDINIVTSRLVRTDQPRPPSLDLVTSAVSWLTERPEIIGIEPKRSNYYRLQEGANLTRLRWLPLGLMTIGLIGLGTGVWVVRRR